MNMHTEEWPREDIVRRNPSASQGVSSAQSCLILCDPMNRSTPGLPVHHQLLQFTQTHVHRVSDAIQPPHSLLSPSPPAPNPSQGQSLFQWLRRQKSSECLDDMNSILILALIDIYRILHPSRAECNYFRDLHEIYINIVYCLGCEIFLHKFKEMETMHSKSLVYNEV